MKPLELVREALASAYASKVPTLLIGFIVAVMCAATLATVGRTAAAEAQLDERLDSAGARVLTISEPSHQTQELINPTVVQQVDRLSLTERAVGMSRVK
ncbi:hypothetical protein [Nesterenkonia alba]|uniref:hypothetical protein n=1 Tax=Nesterenkonia alba TaxID=515814 RepID=UPI0012EBDB00|nr:hypothetical protein [Nesterenkonia alba]